VPRAGKRFVLGAKVTRDDTGETLHEGAVACTAKLAGKRLAPSSPGSFFSVTIIGGGGADLTQATCDWTLPKSARGKRLVASIGVSLEGKTAARTYAGIVR
jgi:hypothetical protein